MTWPTVSTERALRATRRAVTGRSIALIMCVRAPVRSGRKKLRRQRLVPNGVHCTTVNSHSSCGSKPSSVPPAERCLRGRRSTTANEAVADARCRPRQWSTRATRRDASRPGGKLLLPRCDESAVEHRIARCLGMVGHDAVDIPGREQLLPMFSRSSPISASSVSELVLAHTYVVLLVLTVLRVRASLRHPHGQCGGTVFAARRCECRQLALTSCPHGTMTNVMRRNRHRYLPAP